MKPAHIILVLLFMTAIGTFFLPNPKKEKRETLHEALADCISDSSKHDNFNFEVLCQSPEMVDIEYQLLRKYNLKREKDYNIIRYFDDVSNKRLSKVVVFFRWKNTFTAIDTLYHNVSFTNKNDTSKWKKLEN